MIKNIKLIIKKKYKTNKIYFNNEEYNDFYKEFKYTYKPIIFINFSYIYKYLLELLRKYKFLLIFLLLYLYNYT